MRKGVIRPRQFQPAGRHSVPGSSLYAEQARGLGKRKFLVVGIILLLLLLLLLYVLSRPSDGHDLRGASATLSKAGEALIDADEDDDEDSDIEGEHLSKAAARKQDAQDDDEREEEEEEDDDDEDADRDQEDEEEESDDGDDDDDDGTDEEQRQELAAMQATPEDFGNSGKFSIESYFVNLNKKVVNISPSGSFKFVLIHAKDKNGDGAYIVQGCPHRSKTCKHPDAARISRNSLNKYGIEATVLGGGRITRHKLTKSTKKGLISIFGYSRTYGRCEDCNRKVCDFVAAAYPGHVVRYSNEGYLESDESKIRSTFVKCSTE